MRAPMEKHLLLTISKDRESSSNLRFIRHFFEDLCDIRLTLFYVSPRPMDKPYQFAPSALEGGKAKSVPLEELKSSEAREALEMAKEWIVGAGCTHAKVQTKAVYSRFGTVHDIIQEGHAGKYDAVVLGKRGLSWFGEMIDDSVTHRIMWEQTDFPVWVCRRPETGLSQNVLLCVDGSEPAQRMADHVGFMLTSASRHKVTLLHCKQSGVSDSDSQRFLDQARKVLQDNGVAAGMINDSVIKTSDPAQTIVDEAKRGHYSVVALGRRGASSPSTMEKLFPGSVSGKLLRSVEDFSLWISK